MNGTVIDIQGITIQSIPIQNEDSTDKAQLITLTDGIKQITIFIAYGKICDCIIK